MSSYFEQYQIQRISFEMFCEVREWEIESFRSNDKNPSQFVGRCFDEGGHLKTIVVTKEGNYIGYCGPDNGTIGKDKAWEPVEYVLKKTTNDTEGAM